MARESAVLPAPSSPSRWTTDPGASPRPIDSPSASSSASDTTRGSGMAAHMAAAPLHLRRPHGPELGQLVPQDRGALELQVGGRFLHPALQLEDVRRALRRIVEVHHFLRTGRLLGPLG